MEIMNRLKAKYNVRGKWIRGNDGNGVQHMGEQILTGFELSSRIALQMMDIERAQRVLVSMEAILAGETAEEQATREAWEMTHPEEVARGYGWLTLRELRAKLQAEGLPFAEWLPDNESITYMSERNEQYIRSIKDKYPPRHAFYGDHLRFADSWPEAVKRTREAEKRGEQL